jgi:Piwi domain
LSQFVSFKTYLHDRPKEKQKSTMILGSIARQILNKCGVRLWWVAVPPTLPLPAIFVGIDVFHAPPSCDPITKTQARKESVAAIVLEVIRPTTKAGSTVELYSETFVRKGGNEFELSDCIKQTMKNAMKLLDVNPQSCVVWRDGIADSSFGLHAKEEIDAFLEVLKTGTTGSRVVGAAAPPTPAVPGALAYVICQKRIATKMLMDRRGPDGKATATVPPGTLITEMQGMEHQTCYINGRAPSYSTAKPVRFTVVHRDMRLINVPMAQLT